MSTAGTALGTALGTTAPDGGAEVSAPVRERRSGLGLGQPFACLGPRRRQPLALGRLQLPQPQEGEACEQPSSVPLHATDGSSAERGLSPLLRPLGLVGEKVGIIIKEVVHLAAQVDGRLPAARGDVVVALEAALSLGSDLRDRIEQRLEEADVATRGGARDIGLCELEDHLLERRLADAPRTLPVGLPVHGDRQLGVGLDIVGDHRLVNLHEAVIVPILVELCQNAPLTVHVRDRRLPPHMQHSLHAQVMSAVRNPPAHPLELGEAAAELKRHRGRWRELRAAASRHTA